MIKQIQLRGISRTPSDRMSEDGGLSESLNMYLDTAEQAPALVPKDATTELGLPAGLQAERIFIHKTANYENYIVVQSDRVVAYTPGIEDDEPLLILELTEGEKVNNISSVGNTLIISTTNNMYYVLFKDRQYGFLGNNVPMPKIDFYAEKKDVPWIANGYLNFKLQNFDSAQEWNDSDDEDLTSLTEKIWEKEERSLKKTILTLLDKEAFLSPRFIQYSVELNGGSPLASLPILVGAGASFKPIVYANYSRVYTEDQVGNTYLETFITSNIRYEAYSIKARLVNLEELKDWKDIITDIKIYISNDLYLISDYKKEKLKCVSFNQDINGPEVEIDAEFSLEPTMPELDDMLSMGGLVYLLKTIPLAKYDTFSAEARELAEGIDIVASEEYKPEKLNVKDRLSVGDMRNYTIVPSSTVVYNNRLIAINNTALLSYNQNGLGATINNGQPQTTYEVYFVVKRTTKDLCFKADITATIPQYGDLIFCPDASCSRIVVQATRENAIRYFTLIAHPHPTLPCSYASLHDTIYEIDDLFMQQSTTVTLPQVSFKDEKENTLYISRTNEPFVFPAEGRFTFQSEILGVAIATTTLSQGQFGQFPLYVFTEDGIWAMETGADGSFISQKPLSREVCINPDSICSIDNAVVFVTSKAVMMIQGSQVMNISPYMNGKHYMPNDSALNLIRNQEGFDEFENAIKDETPFVAFMKKAKIAYDYTGQRLICIADDETFQYIYKLDTQTWHKVAFNGFDLIAPLNSYPDCLVQGEAQALLKKCIVDINSSKEDREYLIDRVKEYFPSLSESSIDSFLYGQEEIDVTSLNEDTLQDFQTEMSELAISTIVQEKETNVTKIYSLGTILDVDPESEDAPDVAKGILITRPFDLGEPDVYKTIKAIKIRGDYDKENVKYLLQGSDDGKTFYTLSSMRGKSWKMFRLFILADLEPTERISWVDIEYETRFKNRLR